MWVGKLFKITLVLNASFNITGSFVMLIYAMKFYSLQIAGFYSWLFPTAIYWDSPVFSHWHNFKPYSNRIVVDSKYYNFKFKAVLASECTESY